ncbi:hemerythrin domain-containing protein [Pusillimonas sp. ANT_WB101]|uniref:hemerythrin domain-containing protein n=1 Tax=Pusillimonas sp. ANT_WB101 TaxID=2597356 RepID=UPI0011EFD655|nr:hemerythrin domain-containing protein [Pusillimonas sp. ANT_WB101]KAA0890803.1 hemerythrin domain-containing protein [Pusillimonas sp. ANT_WB101]
MSKDITGAITTHKSVLGMLIDDHCEVEALFKDFKLANNDVERHSIVQQTCLALTEHAEIEQKHLYPYLRNADPESFNDLLDEANVQVESARDLIALLKYMKPGDDLYQARFAVLEKFINQHVSEEEGEVFLKVISNGIDLRQLAAPILEAKTKARALSAGKAFDIFRGNLLA